VPDHPLPAATPPPRLARAAVLAHRDAALEGLEWEEESPFVIYVTLPAVRPDGTADTYISRFSFVYYPDWPPSVTFVDPSTKEYSPAHWPRIINSDRLAFHATYGDAPTGLICNSMFFEYYFWGGHGRTEGQAWEKGRHTMAATVSELKIHLAQPYYVGPVE
jgi:hypothetical protein